MEIEAARKIVASLLLARKNQALYPEGHTIWKNAVEALHALLASYTKTYGTLRIYIEKDQLLVRNEVIYSGTMEEGALPVILFRDGIRWLAFMPEISLGEVQTLLDIINRYSMLSDVSEGDIVTALWEKKPPHIGYEVADFAWGEETGSGAGSASEEGLRAMPPQRQAGPTDWSPIMDPPIDQAELALSFEDITAIQAMLAEEHRDPTHTLEILLDGLQYREMETYETILAALADTFKRALVNGDLQTVLKLLQGLQDVLEAGRTEMNPGAVKMLEGFFRTISRPALLEPFGKMWAELPDGRIEHVKEIFTYLQPEALPVLAGCLQLKQSPAHQRMLEDLILTLAGRDIRPLEELLKGRDTKAVHALIPICIKLPGERPLKLLMELVRHPSESVRQEALKGLMSKGSVHMQDFYNLIEDKDPSIRRLILKVMGQTRDHGAERFLLSYLGSDSFRQAEEEHIMLCFTTLGQCGSSRSIPFLRQTLLGRGWLPSFQPLPHLKGAAVALKKLKLKESQEVLEEAGRSLIPRVRRIARREIA